MTKTKAKVSVLSWATLFFQSHPRALLFLYVRHTHAALTRDFGTDIQRGVLAKSLSLDFYSTDGFLSFRSQFKCDCMRAFYPHSLTGSYITVFYFLQTYHCLIIFSVCFLYLSTCEPHVNKNIFILFAPEHCVLHVD